MRVRAAGLSGRRWLNTGDRPLRLSDLRGKFVLLDFWTFACVNCLHVIEELRPLQERFADVLVTVGVHSPKFPHEGEPQAVEGAVARYRVTHPVLDDPDLLTWDAYAARAWPTLVLIDPEGYVIAQVAGEKHAPALAALIESATAEHEARGTLHRGDGPYVPPPPAPDGELSFPGGLLSLRDHARTPPGALLVSDTGHQQLVIGPVRIGTGERGRVDGGPEVAQFDDPLGTALLPPEVAEQVGYDVVVADSGNNALRGLRLSDLTVTTLAATGLSTPWDVAWFGGEIVVATAGVHQLWALDPLTGRTRVLAGTGREGLVDGAARESWFAQPSGLAVGENGGVLWVADAETSALRLLWSAAAPGRPDLQVRTVVGQGLFEFGLVDGPAARARLQHPLAVAVLPDGSVAVADTYNGAVRRYDPASDEVTTLADGLAEPSALALETSTEGLRLVVAESAAHRLERVSIGAAASPGRRRGGVIRRPVADLAPGRVELVVAFEPPAGQKLDDREAVPARLEVSASPAAVLVESSGDGLARTLVLDTADPGGISGGRVEGVLRISAQVVSCDLGDAVGAACHFTRQAWEVPFRLIPGAPTRLTLDLPPGLV